MACWMVRAFIPSYDSGPRIAKNIPRPVIIMTKKNSFWGPNASTRLPCWKSQRASRITTTHNPDPLIHLNQKQDSNRLRRIIHLPSLPPDLPQPRPSSTSPLPPLPNSNLISYRTIKCSSHPKPSGPRRTISSLRSCGTASPSRATRGTCPKTRPLPIPKPDSPWPSTPAPNSPRPSPPTS